MLLGRWGRQSRIRALTGFAQALLVLFLWGSLIGHHELFAAWDSQMGGTIRSQLRGSLNLWLLASYPADRMTTITLGMIVGLFLLLRRAYRPLRFWVTGLVGLSVLVEILKRGLGRPRPSLEAPLFGEPNFSFPSGHSATSVLLYLLLLTVMCHTLPKLAEWREAHSAGLHVGAALLALSVGMSRVALGVHYPGDVLGGWFLGWSWWSLLHTLLNSRSPRVGSIRMPTPSPSEGDQPLSEGLSSGEVRSET